MATGRDYWTGTRLRVLRALLGLTREMLVRVALGSTVLPESVARWERWESAPRQASADRLTEFATARGVDLEALDRLVAGV